MKVKQELTVNISGQKKTIYFGLPDSEREMEEMFRLRFSVYSEKKYIDPEKYPDGLESDDYDRTGKAVYFIAKFGEKMIGTIRLIFEDVLPTERYFSFNEPNPISKIPRNKRVELGRFIIVPPDKDKGVYLPRGVVMLFILDSVVNYGIAEGILGGYSFVKRSLSDKLAKIKAPLWPIRPYDEHYPKDGCLYRYFTQKDDPVAPYFFVTAEFKKFTSGIIGNGWIFKKSGEGKYELKSNLLTQILKILKII